MNSAQLAREELDNLPTLSIIRSNDDMLAAVKLGKRAWIVTGYEHIIPTSFHLLTRHSESWRLVERGVGND